MLLIGFPPLGAILLLPAVLQYLKHDVQLPGHLAPAGTAGFVMANGFLSSGQSSEGDSRKSIIEAELVGCIVTLLGQLFCTTQIPV